MSSTQTLAGMVVDYAYGQWRCRLSPAELIAEFEGVRVRSVEIRDGLEVWVLGRMLTPERLDGLSAWVRREHPEAIGGGAQCG